MILKGTYESIAWYPLHVPSSSLHRSCSLILQILQNRPRR